MEPEDKLYGVLKSKNDKIPKIIPFWKHKPMIPSGNETMNIKFDLEKDCFIEIKKEKVL